MTKTALLITVGSRGDAEPFVSLAQSLSAEGYGVDLFLQKDLTQLADTEDKNVVVHELPFTQMDFYKFVGNPSHGKGHPNPRVSFIGIVADVIGELVLPCFDQVAKEGRVLFNNSEREATATTSVIVTSSLAKPLALALGQALDIPVCVVNLQPLTPTNQFPHYSDTTGFLGALANKGQMDEAYRETYVELENYQCEFLEDRLSKLYHTAELLKEKENISFEALIDMLEGNDDTVLIANAYEEALIPKCVSAGAQVIHTGALADKFHPASGVPQETESAIASFLESNGDEKPMCIGFGSMPVGKAQNVIDAAKELGKPTILVGDAFQPLLENDDDAKILNISAAPYPWLLPKCSMMACHGGAGTLHSTVRAGIPIVICPLIGDQFVHARLVESLGVGVQGCANLGALEKQDLVDALQKADDDAMKGAASKLGAVIRSKPAGVEVLKAELVKRFLSE